MHRLVAPADRLLRKGNEVCAAKPVEGQAGAGDAIFPERLSGF